MFRAARALSFGGVLICSLMSGCASSTDDYCSALATQEKELAALAEGARNPDGDLFANSLVLFESMREEAPDDIVDEWDTLVFAWEGVGDAFAEADVSPEDFQLGGTSGDMTDDEAQAIADAAQELGSTRVVEAGNGIEQHAKDVCKVDLGL